MTAPDAEGGPEAFYPGFEEDARMWGLQTSAGVCRVPRVVAFCPPRHGVTVSRSCCTELHAAAPRADPWTRHSKLWTGYVLRPHAHAILYVSGITAGVVMGWVKGARGSAHLAGTYGQGNIYRGLFAEFRVPANFVQVSHLRTCCSLPRHARF